MTWTKKSANGWLVANETMTLGTNNTDQSTSVIDFVPYGKDWWIEIDPSATLASGGPIDIDICYESGGTFWEMATTGLSIVAAGTSQRDLIDVTTEGIAPYYKLRIDKTATQTAATSKTVKFTVLVPPKNGIVY
jgi:hypothetical protein